MLKSARKKGIEEEAFRFLKWWVSAAVQTEYGLELEASLGVAARHTPASKEALAQMGWSAQELAALKEGMSWCVRSLKSRELHHPALSNQRLVRACRYEPALPCADDL